MKGLILFLVLTVAFSAPGYQGYNGDPEGGKDARTLLYKSIYLQLIFREEQLFIVCDDYVVAEGKGEVKDDRPSFKELYAILMGKVLAILVS